MKQIWELGFTPSGVCFWSGAGISVAKPPCLLLGDQLTAQIIDRFCLDCTWERVTDYMTFAAITDAQGHPKRIPRLEVVLQAVVEIPGFETLNCLAMFDRPANFLHRFFAWHLSNGGAHITMNSKARAFVRRKQGLDPGSLFDGPCCHST